MKELPRVNVSEDFYMWFDLEEKKEHYATPLYLYQVKRDRINPDDETKLYLKLEKDISKVKAGKDKEVIRHPSTIYIHYVENLGAMLINFLNADFTNYETAYNTFFYAYGYELVKDYDICLGQHTNVCVGNPISDPESIPSLVQEDGTFKTSKMYRSSKEDFVNFRALI